MKILENCLLPRTSHPRATASMAIDGVWLVPINLFSQLMVICISFLIIFNTCAEPELAACRGANRLLAKIRLDSHLAICTTWVIKLE